MENRKIMLESKNKKLLRQKGNSEPTKERVINKRLFIYLGIFSLFLPLGLVAFSVDAALGCLMSVIALVFLALLVITPVSYVFSEENVVIKYLLGLEESILWSEVACVMTRAETSKGIYLTKEEYEIYYPKEKKKSFFMQGRISKSKATTELMKKYCPKKID